MLSIFERYLTANLYKFFIISVSSKKADIQPVPEITPMPEEELPDVLEYVQKGLGEIRLKLKANDLNEMIAPKIHYIGKNSTTINELFTRIQKMEDGDDKIVSLDLEWNDPKFIPGCPKIGLMQLAFRDGHIYLLQGIEKLSGTYRMQGNIDILIIVITYFLKSNPGLLWPFDVHFSSLLSRGLTFI